MDCVRDSFERNPGTPRAARRYPTVPQNRVLADLEVRRTGALPDKEGGRERGCCRH